MLVLASSTSAPQQERCFGRRLSIAIEDVAIMAAPHGLGQAGDSSVGRASDCRSLQLSDGPWFDSGSPDLCFGARSPRKPSFRWPPLEKCRLKVWGGGSGELARIRCSKQKTASRGRLTYRCFSGLCMGSKKPPVGIEPTTIRLRSACSTS